MGAHWDIERDYESCALWLSLVLHRPESIKRLAQLNLILSRDDVYGSVMTMALRLQLEQAL